MGFLHSEGTTMLCMPPAEVYERLTSMLSSMSIVSGLVFSAMADSALNPLDPQTFPQSKRSTVEVYNVLAALTVVTQLCVVLYSTFTLYMIMSSAHNSTATYRSLMHMTRWIGFIEFMTFVPALCSFVLIYLAASLRCGAASTLIVLCVTCALVASFQSMFCWMCMHAFPYNAWAWASLAASGVPWLLPWQQAAARNHGELLLAQAAEGVLGGFDDGGDHMIDDDGGGGGGGGGSGGGGGGGGGDADESEADSLVPWVEGALKDLGPTRCGLLAKELHTAGLTRTRMVEAVRHLGGFQVLCDMLKAHESGPGGLRPGHRLALATAAMRTASEDSLKDWPCTAPSPGPTSTGRLSTSALPRSPSPLARFDV